MPVKLPAAVESYVHAALAASAKDTVAATAWRSIFAHICGPKNGAADDAFWHLSAGII